MDLLSVKGDQIVNAQGQPVRLRGTCVGGWMNMEDFINGYPGPEHGLRATLAEVLGAGRAQFFFDRLLDYFFAEDDLAFIKACGATVVRLPMNYRHLESDADPFRYLEAGFERLSRVVDMCERHGLYVILDLHSVQGWQNTDWHCDNMSRHTLFWTHKHFQDRFVALWEELARRFKGQAAIAGYNVMNEPVTNAPRGRFGFEYKPDWPAINGVYRRVVGAIRAIDPDHIIFLEGDYFSSRFAGLDAPFANNLVYSSHNYTMAGFGPGAYPGQIRKEHWDRQKQEKVFLAHEGMQFARKHHVPLWVGEFGSVYNGAANEVPDRLRAMDDQLALFEDQRVHWTTWTYKDVGVMGWVSLNPDSEYLRRLARLLESKRLLDTDFWMGWLPSTPAKEIADSLAHLVEEVAADPEVNSREHVRYLHQAVFSNYVAGLLQPSYAKAFKGLSETDLDRVLQSFAFKNCQPRQNLVQVLQKHLAHP